jgi:hypothetical protein
VRYWLSRTIKCATGVIGGDHQPLHAACGSPLAGIDGFTEAGGHRRYFEAATWECQQCDSTGMLQHLPEYIRRRERTLPAPSRRPDPPSDPNEWQPYLDEYFADGVLFLGANDDPEHSVRETSIFLISDEVRVANGEFDVDRPGLAIYDHGIGRTHYLSSVTELVQPTAGVLIVIGARNRYARLHARLTDEERLFVQEVRASAQEAHDE